MVFLSHSYTSEIFDCIGSASIKFEMRVENKDRYKGKFTSVVFECLHKAACTVCRMNERLARKVDIMCESL